MTPLIDDDRLVLTLIRRLQVRLDAYDAMDIAHRLSVIETRCADHSPVIKDVKTAKIRSDAYSDLWRCLITYGTFCGILIALVANMTKIIDFFAR